MRQVIPLKKRPIDMVLLANAPWLIFPFIIIYRMWRSEHPFTEEGSGN